MGKCRKRSKRSTAYPYRAIPVSSQIHVVRPKVRSDGTAPMFLGLFCDPGVDISQKIMRRRASGQLKRLGFVRTYGTYCWARANKLMASFYSNSRSCLPGMFDSPLRKVEHRFADATLPFISAMQAKSNGVLAKLDNQVDNYMDVANNAAHVLNSFLHKAVPGENGTSDLGALLQKLVKSSSSSSLGKMGEKESEFHARGLETFLLGIPAVLKLLESNPGVEFTRKKYFEAHNVIVASASYAKTYDIAAGFVNRVQHSAFYHLACRYVYPIVCNYTDPALDALHHSGFIKEMVDHLRPHAGSAPDSPVSDLERESFRRCCLIV